MSDAATFSLQDEVDQVTDALGVHGITAYVQISRPCGSYCGATILFDFHRDADFRFHAMALVSSTRARFYSDDAFRAALSRESFQIGTLLQNWNDPVPNLNF